MLTVQMRIEQKARDVLAKLGAPAVIGARRLALHRFARELIREVVKRTPAGNGQLRQAWQVEAVQNGIIIRNPLKYSVYVEFGTGLFGPRKRLIVPKKPGGVLAWHTGKHPSARRVGTGRAGKFTGSIIFRKWSRGMKPRWMFRDSLKVWTPKFPEMMFAELKKALGGSV